MSIDMYKKAKEANEKPWESPEAFYSDLCEYYQKHKSPSIWFFGLVMPILFFAMGLRNLPPWYDLDNIHGLVNKPQYQSTIALFYTWLLLNTLAYWAVCYFYILGRNWARLIMAGFFLTNAIALYWSWSITHDFGYFSVQSRPVLSDMMVLIDAIPANSFAISAFIILVHTLIISRSVGNRAHFKVPFPQAELQDLRRKIEKAK